MTKKKVGWESRFDKKFIGIKLPIVGTNNAGNIEFEKEIGVTYLVKSFIRQLLAQELRGLRDGLLDLVIKCPYCAGASCEYCERVNKLANKINQRLKEVK